METLVSQIETAFAGRSRPGADRITHCTYDRRNGGAFDGPCPECERMAAFFASRSWRGLGGAELRTHGEAEARFTVEAYCYFLPAYLTAALREPDELDVGVDALTYRFGPEPGHAFGEERLRAILAELDEAELAAVLAYFRHALARDGDFDDYGRRAIENLEAELAARRA